jgi:RNA polymerase-interacting CarD/CdnL/TRCF family regulator
MQAVVALKQDAAIAVVRQHLADAVRLAPTDAGAWINLAVATAAEGNVGWAQRQLTNVDLIYRGHDNPVAPVVRDLQRQLEEYNKKSRN